ncbi:MAG TPA: hypothetical protein VKF80_05085 [Candidatus Eisenbacteria bacterium]|nr:hypothetical protein [Candidatus Eisenbacteria bacterium]
MKESGGRTQELRLAFLTGVAVLFVYLACAGGRIVASDEHTMFLLTQSLVERHTVAVPEGNAEVGPDGRLYPKAGIGQALAAAPFYVLGKLAAPFAPPRLRPFVVRAGTSLVNPFAGGVLAAVFLLLLLELGLAPRQALGLTAVAAFATPLWVYAKLFLGETLLATGLTVELYGVTRLRKDGGMGAAALAALGFGFAILVKYAIAPAAVLFFLPALPELKRVRPALASILIVGASLAVALAYDVARTGNLISSGYGRQGTLAAFSTPIWVGLYGLLFSSGKGLLWFAPVVALAPAGFLAWRRIDSKLAMGVAAGVVVTILLYATFEHWAGDGSWGPRYLVPLVPALVAAVGARLANRSLPDRRVWWGTVLGLGLLGAAVQVGGVAIYFGAQMREAGDYPYTRALSDPRFMNESHWNPYFTPIAGHWRMLARNLREHLSGHVPHVSLSDASAASAVAAPSDATTSRIGVSEEQATALTHGFDLWPAYAVYAGLPAVIVLLAWALVWLVALAYGSWALRQASWMTLRQGPSVRPAPPPEQDSGTTVRAGSLFSMTEPR